MSTRRPATSRRPSKRYPVLYLLHGSGDNDSHWTLLGRANVIADNLLADGRAVPMLIVMPDGHVADRSRERENGDRSRWREPFEKDLLESVVPLVEANYRVLADRAAPGDRRAVDGRRPVDRRRAGASRSVRLGRGVQCRRVGR